MFGSRTPHERAMVLACALAMLAGLPPRSGAQSVPEPAPTMPKVMTKMGDSTAKAVTGAMNAGGAQMMALSDSARASLQSQIGHELRMLGDSLKLTPDQKAKVKPILVDHAMSLAGIRDKYSKLGKSTANMAAMKQEVLKLRDATDTKLASVLSPAQLTAYKAKRDQWMKSAVAKLGTTAMPH